MEITDEDIIAFQRVYSEAAGIELDHASAGAMLLEVLTYLRWLHQFDDRAA